MPENENPKTENSTTENAESAQSESTPSEPLIPSLEPQRKVARHFVSKVISDTAIALARWMPIGGSGFAFISFLLEQEWLMVLITFPVTIVMVIWAAYSESILKRLWAIYQERGSQDVDTFMAWQYRVDREIREAIRWTFAGTDEKYLKCQGYDCRQDRVEGFKPSPKSSIISPQLEQVFVPLELSGLPTSPSFNSRTKDLEDLEKQMQKSDLSIWTLLAGAKRNPTYQRLLVKAHGGYGKTTLLRHVTYTYARKGQKRGVPKLLPVFLRLRDWQKQIAAETPPDLPGLIEKHHIPHLPKVKPFKVPPHWAKNKLRDGKMLVMLDGFDEVRQEWRTRVSHWIGAQMQEYPQSFFILTSRPAAISDYTSKHEPSVPLFVKDFNPDQQELFVRRWYLCQERKTSGGSDTPDVRAEADRQATALLRQLRARPELNALAKNPLLLNMIATLHRTYPSTKLPQRRTELYRLICNLQLGDRPLFRDIEMGCSPECSLKILQALALSMVRENQTKIEYDELIQKVKNYLSQSEEIESIAPAKFVKNMEEVSELLVKVDDCYEFSHLSFQGYLAAREIKEKKQARLLLKHYSEAWWKETILLYGAQASTPKFSHLIRQLCDIGTCEAVALAYACLQESPRKVSAELVAELQKLRYQPLEEYFQQGDWRKADEETSRLMLQTVGKEENQLLNIEDIENFPCEDLRTLNELWVKYSNGHFGFSVQKEIWIECGGKPGVYDDYESYVRFADRVGWRSGGFNRNDLNFTIASDRGHLPFLYYPSHYYDARTVARIRSSNLLPLIHVNAREWNK